MDNRFIGLIIGLVVGVLMIGSLLVPVINEASTTEKTFTNDGGYYRMAELSADDDAEYTLNWDKSATTHLEINGQDYDAYSAYGQALTTVVASDSWLLRYSSANTAYGYLQYFDGTTWMGDDTTTQKMEFVASGGTAVLTRTSTTDQVTTKTVTYEYIYVIMPDATSDIMKKPTETPYVKGDSELYAMGLTSSKLFQISGNVNDGITVDILGESEEVISNLEINKVAVEGYIDLYVISSITFDYTISGTTASATYNFFIVPYSVTAELSNHLDAGEIAMIAVIPVLMIASLLIFAVRFVTRD